MPRALFAAALCLAVPVLATPADAETRALVAHDLTVTVEPDSRALTVRQGFTVEHDGTILLRLAPWMAVIDAQLDGEEVAVERRGDRLLLDAPEAGSGAVDLSLAGRIPALPPAEQRGGARGALAGPEGVYLPGGVAWMADLGDDWITYDLTVAVPAAYRTAATGRLVDERLDESRNSARFAADYPAEPPSLFVGPYAVAERRSDGLRVRTYLHPELEGLAETYLEASADYVRRYAEIVGPYPYADFFVVSAPLPVGLGFPNLTYVGRRVLPLPFMRGRSLAHEVLHNWWGNAVAVNYRRGNWAEGLTTFMADYALAEDRGAPAAREMRLGWLQNFAALAPERRTAVTAFVTKRHDAAQVIGYDKAAFLFHMLRAELGEAAFAAGLQRFWRAQKFRVAAWSDLQSAFEAATGSDLDWFFEQWLERADAPQVALLAAEPSEQGNGLTLRIGQETPPYRLSLPVLVETDAGDERHTLRLERATEDVELALQGRPRTVTLDPDFEIFRELLPGESPPIFRDTTLAPEAVLVLPSDDRAIAETGRRLAGRLLQRRPETADAEPDELKGVAVLAIGRSEDIEALRQEAGPFSHAEAVAAMLEGPATARAWSARRTADDRPWFFVAVEDAAALDAIARPLPHYRRRSFVVFEGSKAIDKGYWPATANPLSRRFDD